MKTVLIAGAWGSGTSAVGAALHHLGVTTFGPFLMTNDPNTPNSYEWLPFRELMLRHTHPPSVSRITDSSLLISDLRRFRDEVDQGKFGDWPSEKSNTLLLKMPIASICLPEIVEVMNPFVVVVQRPLNEIEKTRNRRGWHEFYGMKGAGIIYSKVFRDLIQLKKSFIAVSYNDLICDTRSVLQSIIDFCGLQHLQMHLDAACATVRGKASPSAATKC